METGTDHNVNFLAVCYAHRFRITLAVGLVLLPFIFAEVSAYFQKTRFLKVSKHTENDLAEITETAADLSTRKTSRNVRVATARSSPAALRQAFFTHLLDQGKEQMRRQDYIGALNTFEKVLGLGSRDPALHYFLADVHRALGSYALSDRFREIGDARTIGANLVSKDAGANAEPGDIASTTSVIIEMAAQPAATRMSSNGSHPN